MTLAGGLNQAFWDTTKGAPISLVNISNIVIIIYSIQNIFYSDTKTRYESSILLWEQFILSTSDTSAWVYETQEKLAVIRSSTLDTKTLLEEIKVSDTG